MKLHPDHENHVILVLPDDNLVEIDDDDAEAIGQLADYLKQAAAAADRVRLHDVMGSSGARTRANGAPPAPPAPEPQEGGETVWWLDALGEWRGV